MSSSPHPAEQATEPVGTIRAYRRVFDALEQAGRADIDDLLDRYQAGYVQMLLPTGSPSSTG